MDMQSIYDSCLLFRLSISTWNPQLTAAQASDEVAAHYGADRDAAKVVKTLLPKKVSNKIATTRTQLLVASHRYTLPYDDSASRLCTPEAYDHILQNWPKWEAMFNEMRDEVIQSYDVIKADAPNRLGRLYDAKDWPAKIDSFFKIEPILTALPKSDNLPNRFGRARAEEIKANAERYVSERLAEAVKANWQNILESIHWFRGVLSDSKADGTTKDQIRIREDTLKRLKDQIELYESLNFSGDPRIQQVVDLCRDELFKYNVDQLRAHDVAREYVRQRADDISNAMQAIWA